MVFRHIICCRYFLVVFPIFRIHSRSSFVVWFRFYFFWCVILEIYLNKRWKLHFLFVTFQLQFSFSTMRIFILFSSVKHEKVILFFDSLSSIFLQLQRRLDNSQSSKVVGTRHGKNIEVFFRAINHETGVRKNTNVHGRWVSRRPWSVKLLLLCQYCMQSSNPSPHPLEYLYQSSQVFSLFNIFPSA